VPIHVDIHAPEGIPFDWLDLKLTPRRPEVPPRVILATGVAPATSEGMYANRLVAPVLDLRVRPGLYDLRAHRVVEDVGKRSGPVNLIADRVMTDGPPATPKYGGFEVELGPVTRLTIGLRPMTREGR